MHYYEMENDIRMWTMAAMINLYLSILRWMSFNDKFPSLFPIQHT